MLPWPHGERTADLKQLPRLPGANRVGDETILRPVTAADHIAGAGARHRDALGTQEGIPVTGDDDFTGRLAGAVRVSAAERIVFPVVPRRVSVTIDLVGRDHDRRASAL